MRPDEGQVFLDGAPIQDLPPHRIFSAGLSRTFQIPRPFPEMSVLENVMMVPLNQAGEMFWNNWFRPGVVARQEREARGRASEIIEFCGLTRVRGDQADTLSGGQLKLLELARVLMVDPEIILLDEPAAGLSSMAAGELFALVRDLVKNGAAVLMVEQNAKAALRVSDRGYVLAEGRNRMDGPAQDLLEDEEIGEVFLGMRREDPEHAGQEGNA